MKVIITDGDRREYAPPIIPSRCGTPCYMEIVKPPDKLVYSNGEAIDITGMEVIAYACDGKEWGEVPHEWLTIDPDTVVTSDTWTDGDGVVAKLYDIYYVDDLVGKYYHDAYRTDQIGETTQDIEYEWYSDKTYISCSTTAKILLTQYNNRIYGMYVGDVPPNMNPGANTRYLYINNSGYYGNYNHYAGNDRFYDIGVGYADKAKYMPVSTKNPLQAGEMQPESSGDIITVTWDYDEEHTFTDTFQITIE